MIFYFMLFILLTIIFVAVKKLKQSEKLLVCGQAMSHCVNYTVRDIVEHWPEDEMNKITLLKDCASSVPGFEAASDKFVEDMVQVGVAVETSEDVSI
jgi:nicotinamidase/pyrazinamidase